MTTPQPRAGASRRLRAAAFPLCADAKQEPRRFDASLINWGRWAKRLSPLFFVALAACAPTLRISSHGSIEGISYRNDADIYGVEDYWARPAETIALRAGDCEDQAILGAWLLWTQGVSTFRMRLVYGEAAGLGAHMWLLVDGAITVDTAAGVRKTTWAVFRFDERAFVAASPKRCILLGECTT